MRYLHVGTVTAPLQQRVNLVYDVAAESTNFLGTITIVAHGRVEQVKEQSDAFASGCHQSSQNPNY